jgi:DNA-binding CsgD family transcriptional regulator/tetratricopeptide (TPR) repeat protein
MNKLNFRFSTFLVFFNSDIFKKLKCQIMALLMFPVFILTIISCDKGIDNRTLTQAKQETYFDEYEVIKAFENLNNSKKWLYLLEILQTDYKNAEEVRVWIDPFIENLVKSSEKIDSKLIGEIVKLTYDGTYQNAAMDLSNFVFKNYSMDEYDYLNGISSLIQLNYYTNIYKKDSIDKYLNVLEKSIENDDSNLLKIAYYQKKASLAIKNGQFFEATVNYYNALNLIDINDKKNRATLYMDLAILYNTMDYNEKASYYSEKVLDLVDYNDLSTLNINNLGIIQSKNKDYIKATESFQRVIERALIKKNPSVLAQAYSNYGNMKRRQQLYPEALKYMAKSDSISLANGIYVGLLINGINRSELFYDRGEFDKAQTMLFKCKNILEEFNNPKFNLEYYKLSYKIQDSLGNKNLANTFFRTYKEADFIYFGDLARSAIAEWELAREQQLRSLETAAISLSLEQQKRGKYVVAFLLSLLLFIVSIFYFLRNKQILIEKETFNKNNILLAHKLEMKSKELLFESLNNLNIQNTKNAIFQDLKALVNELPTVHQSKFKNLAKKLKASSNDKFLDEFEIRFTGVYEEFYNKILGIAPDLTPNELKVCGLIRLNISSKEIAILTNRTPGTIENTRMSIRKKLNLSNQDNLQQFFMNLS